MASKTARRFSVFDPLEGQNVKNQVCSFWLAGKCNRNPCRFMHRESPPPQPQHHHPSVSCDSHSEVSHKFTWKNPNQLSAKKGTISANERNRSNGNRGLQTQQKVSNVVTAESEINSVEEVQPNQCKYWITSNCLLGDKCKNMHSWSCGSGLTVLTKLQGHDKVSSIATVFKCFEIRVDFWPSLELLFLLAVTSYSQPAGINLSALGTATVVSVLVLLVLMAILGA